jgi:hypothetical protein
VSICKVAAQKNQLVCTIMLPVRFGHDPLEATCSANICLGRWQPLACINMHAMLVAATIARVCTQVATTGALDMTVTFSPTTATTITRAVPQNHAAASCELQPCHSRLVLGMPLCRRRSIQHPAAASHHNTASVQAQVRHQQPTRSLFSTAPARPATPRLLSSAFS